MSWRSTPDGRHYPVIQHPHASAPFFIIDENLPEYVAYELRAEGYNAKHVHEIWRNRFGPFISVQDSEISKYAERHKAVVITRDTVSFPEPRGSGDRIIVKDVPGKASIDEVKTRIKDLGW